MKLEMLNSIMFRSLTADFTQPRQYICKVRAEIYIRPLKYSTAVTELISAKHILARQLYVRNFETEFHANRTHGLAACLNFMFKPCIDLTSLNNNQLMHSQFNIY